MIVGQALGAITQCPAAGGVATPVTLVAAGDPEAHLFPVVPSRRPAFHLPLDFVAVPERSGIYVTAFNDPSPAAGKRLLTTGFAASYVAAIDSGPGLLVFGRDGALFAQRFDDRQLQLVGEPISLADRVGTFLDGADFWRRRRRSSIGRRRLRFSSPGSIETAATWDGSAPRNT